MTAHRDSQTQNDVAWGPGPPDWDRIGGVVRMHCQFERVEGVRTFAVCVPATKPAPSPEFSTFEEAWNYLECWRICHGLNPDGSPR